MNIKNLAIALLVILTGATAPLFAQFGGGSGTPANPYLISNIVHLNSIRGATYLNKSYRQTVDIDMSATDPAKVNAWVSGTSYVSGDFVKYSPGGTQFTYICIQATNSIAPGNTAYWTQMWESAKGWKPIGDLTVPFTGVYEGNGKVVSNLYINRAGSPTANTVYPSDGEDYVGLFGLLYNNPAADTVIRDLGVLNPNVRGRRSTGSLVGRSLLPYATPAPDYTVIIERCYAIPSGVGGSATVSGFGATGGLVGANNSDRKQQIPVIRYSYASVTVSATHPNNTARNPNDESSVNGVFNPYNIKYGGLVGCNENGLTMDSFARGNVSGGDRVGGVAGCSIGGAIFRSYATGTVTRGIAPGDWEGGIGGVVGRVVGKLPSGLGGTISQANSVQDAYWDTQTSGQLTSPGGTGKTTAQMKTQATFVNWDFVNVWGISPSINDGYPYLMANPTSAFYYRTKASGGWTSLGTWQYSADNLLWNDAVVIPDHSNSLGITIINGHSVSLGSDIIADQMTIDSGGAILIPTGRQLSIFNGSGTDLAINGSLTITGVLTLDLGTLVTAGSASEVIFNATTAQATSSLFPTTVHNIVINNPAGVSFASPMTINGTLSVLSGGYSGAGTPNGYYSPVQNQLVISQTASNISGFSVSMSTPALYPDRVDRQWAISGSFTGTKTMRMYWTSVDDHAFNWPGYVPAAWEGGVKHSAIAYDTTGDPRWLEVTVSSFSAKGDWTIGLESEQTLPVVLSSFTATISASQYAMLQWITQSETNVAGYRILRNTIPEVGSATMLSVFISGTNSSQTQTYVYEDTEIYAEGTYYYWLQNVDLTGENSLYGPVSVTLSHGTDPGVPIIPTFSGIERIYPNPFNPVTTISYGIQRDAEVDIRVYNPRGQLVTKLEQGAKSAGTHKIMWDGSDARGAKVTSGVYLLVIRIGNEVYSQKMTLSK